jgi:hypothetical protein
MMPIMAPVGTPAAITNSELIPKIFILLTSLDPNFLYTFIPQNTMPAVPINRSTPTIHNTDVFRSWDDHIITWVGVVVKENRRRRPQKSNERAAPVRAIYSLVNAL